MRKGRNSHRHSHTHMHKHRHIVPHIHVTSKARQAIAQGSIPRDLSPTRPDKQAGTFASSQQLLHASLDTGGHDSSALSYLRSHSGLGGGNLKAVETKCHPALASFQELRRQDLEAILQVKSRVKLSMEKQ